MTAEPQPAVRRLRLMEEPALDQAGRGTARSSCGNGRSGVSPITFARLATAAASRRLCTPSLAKTFLTYVRKVLTAMFISPAICRVCWPAAIWCSTS